VSTPLWRRPIWILGHVIALTACLLFVRLGLWQLDRLEEKKARNDVIAERADAPPVDALTVVGGDEAEYRHVVAEGSYDDDGTVTIRNRSLQGTVGRHVVTPLVLADGSWLYVNRGWIALEGDVPDAPAGDVEVEGLLRATEERGSIGPRDPAEGALRELNRVDLERLQQQVDVEVQPHWLQLTSSTQESPILLDPLARDEGPHLSYAIQWFLFTAVVGIGYPVLLRRRMQQASDERRQPAVDGDHLTGDVAGIVGQQEHHR
jgi:cytochrome oxidase assembly protein ShyY1